MLRERDAGKGRIDFVDISSPDYDAADNAGISFEQVRRWMRCSRAVASAQRRGAASLRDGCRYGHDFNRERSSKNAFL